MAKETDEEVKNEQVVLSKNEFASLMARIEHLENPGVQRTLKRVSEHVGHLRMWDGKVVTSIGEALQNFDLPEHHPNHLTIALGLTNADGKEEKKTVNFSDFTTHAPKVAIKFLEITRKERVEVDPEKGGGGYGNKHLVDSEGRARPDLTGEALALEVGFIDLAAKVEVTEGEFKGKTFEFSNKTINAINA